jgi:hypothetical protein
LPKGNKEVFFLASKEEMERLVGKVISDGSFRQSFLKEPKASASKVGIVLTPEQEASFKKADFAKMVGELEKVASKSGCISPCM